MVREDEEEKKKRRAEIKKGRRQRTGGAQIAAVKKARVLVVPLLAPSLFSPWNLGSEIMYCLCMSVLRDLTVRSTLGLAFAIDLVSRMAPLI